MSTNRSCFGLAFWLAALLLVAPCMVPSAAAQQSEPPAAVAHFDIPKIATLDIDGHGIDWGAVGFHIDAFVPRSGRVLPAADFRPKAIIAWGEQGLCVLVSVQDDVAAESPKQAPWAHDSVELFVAAGEDLAQAIQVVISPGLDPAYHSEVTYKVFDRRVDQEPAIEPIIGRRVRPGLYQLEVLLPWSALGIDPEQGETLALNLQVNDRDHPSRDQRYEMTWYPTGWAGKGPQFMHRLRLSDAASPAVTVNAALSPRPSLHTQQVLAVAAADLAGTDVTVHHHERTLGSAKLKAVDGLAVARVRVDTRGLPYDSPVALSVRTGDRVIAGLALQDPRPAVRQAVLDARLHIHPVFSGRDFPAIDFETPAWIDALLGDYTVTTAYYDRQLNAVTEATEPGRYGAVTTVTSDALEPVHRYTTLYRTPDDAEVDWSAFKIEGVNLPEGLGLDPAVLDRQRSSLQRFAQGELRGKLDHDTPGPVLFSWLHETAADAPAMHSGHDPWSADQRYWLKLRKQLGHFEHRYHLYLPEGYDDLAHADTRWPVILFLHGSGERGLDPQPKPKHGPAVMAERDGMDMPFIVISPQCEPGQWWGSPRVLDLLDEVLPELRADPDRVYLTGLSMGGYGSWHAAIAEPERFAAVAPICGGGEPDDAAQLVGLPVWAFHGDDDRAVVPEKSIAMIDAIEEAGGRHAALTMYPGVGHNSWSAAYRNPDLYAWLLANRRGQPPVAPTDQTLQRALEAAAE